MIINFVFTFIMFRKGCPRVVRMDCGTENVKVAATQFAFRADHDDSHAGVKSFAYGTSPANVVRMQAITLKDLICFVI